MPLKLELAERFRFYRLSTKEKAELLGKLRRKLEEFKEISLALVYGSLLERYPFRDVDVAVYVAGEGVDPLKYKLKLDSTLTDYLGYPVDVKVLNRAPAWFIKEVLEGGRALLVRDLLLPARLYLRAVDEEEAVEKALKRLKTL